MKRLESLAQQLVDSVAKNDSEKVKELTYLFKEDINLPVEIKNNVKNDNIKRNALTVAVHHKFIELVKYLLDNLADVNIHTNNGKFSALTEAIYHSDSKILKILLEKANSDTKHKALKYAIQVDKTECVNIISDSILGDHEALFETVEQVSLCGDSD